MADQQRVRRLTGQIKTIVARMLESRIKDPRLGFVTVTDARLTGDYQHATIYYTVLGDEKAWADTAAALESATGVIRSEVGRQTGIRLTPTLKFVPDSVPEVAAAMEARLREVRQRDAELAAAAAGARHAGESDPYRRSPDAESDYSEHVVDPDALPEEDVESDQDDVESDQDDVER
ncbi:MAG TPA: 30S ribosome-binding factor RbfA [Actinomycetaceae bacterium]|nr:30S ribosome-binding factor RbfA [Actinomycetaceae bacterium]